VAGQRSPYPWAPGQVATGSKVFETPVIFAQPQVIQGGTYTYPPSMTAPGTVASGGTVANSTGLDAVVYASATGGISAQKVLSTVGAVTTAVTVPGSVSPGNTGQYSVAGAGAIALTYAGTLTWAWTPA
jgi:hypothetical protein